MVSDRSKIEWTDATWNPVRGCSRVSEGCRHCYAETTAARFSGPGLWAEGYAERTAAGPRWTGKVDLVPEKLDQPLRWKRGRRIFVNSMSDLFHESLTNGEIAAVFGVMAAAPQHCFQVLTKRPERVLEWFRWVEALGERTKPAFACGGFAFIASRRETPRAKAFEDTPWPLPNVHLYVSAEDQATLDERVPLLLQCPAAVRGVSLEPLLGPVDLSAIPPFCWEPIEGDVQEALRSTYPEGLPSNSLNALVSSRRLDHVIVGGESGPGARPCDVAWIRSVVEQCREVGVACFVKQDSGPKPGMQGRLSDDLWAVKEYPADLRVREAPE